MYSARKYVKEPDAKLSERGKNMWKEGMDWGSAVSGKKNHHPTKHPLLFRPLLLRLSHWPPEGCEQMPMALSLSSVCVDMVFVYSCHGGRKLGQDRGEVEGSFFQSWGHFTSLLYSVHMCWLPGTQSSPPSQTPQPVLSRILHFLRQ